MHLLQSRCSDKQRGLSDTAGMSQQPLFSVEVARFIANPFPTADLKVVAVGRDNLEYACKRQVDAPDLPASEWLCYHLGYATQIALPGHAVLVEPDGTQHFGSRWEGGVKQWSNIPVADQIPTLIACASDISRILALDLFIANPDRHLNNFFFRSQAVAGGLTVMAFDFSRALLLNGWPSSVVPMPPSENTMGIIGFLKSQGMWDATAAGTMLASIQSVTVANLGHWLNTMPAAWLAPAAQTALTSWWSCPKFGLRLQACAKLI